MEGCTYSLVLIFGSFLFPSSRTSVQGRNFLQVRESIFQIIWLSCLFFIFILLFESPRQLNKGCCVLPHLGVEIKLSEILRLEPPFQELGGTVSFLPGKTLGKYYAPFCYGELTRLRLCYVGERVFLIVEIQFIICFLRR